MLCHIITRLYLNIRQLQIPVTPTSQQRLTCATLRDTIYGMQSVNIRQLRDTRRLKTWLRAGKTVELRERDRVIARIVPEGQPTSTAKWPDFAARAKKVLGDQILPGADLVIQERGRY
jgi:antitoxin (DNA-binding transcriptional repressor) of toxin-antitoxin stability system